MRILTIAKANTPHGVRPVASLLRRGQEVMLLDETDPFPEGRPGYSFVHLPLDSPASIEVIRRVAKAFRPDVVHVHWVDYRAAAALLADVAPVVLSVWGTDINQWLTASAQGMASHAPEWFGATLKHAAQVIVDDATMPAKCAMLAGGPVSCAQLHLGIDETLYQAPQLAEQARQIRTSLDVDDDGFIFLSPRAFSDRYRHHNILEAFSRVTKSSNAWLVFKTFYNNPPYDPSDYEIAVRTLAARLGCAHRLRWVNALQEADLPALYAACDAIVNYPVMDAFPVTFLEAMAAKRPIVTCRHDAYAGTAAESAAIFCEHSTRDLGIAMERALALRQSPHHRQRLERISEQICTQFAHTRYIDGLMEIYARLTTSRAE